MPQSAQKISRSKMPKVDKRKDFPKWIRAKYTEEEIRGFCRKGGSVCGPQKGHDNIPYPGWTSGVHPAMRMLCARNTRKTMTILVVAKEDTPYKAGEEYFADWVGVGLYQVEGETYKAKDLVKVFDIVYKKDYTEAQRDKVEKHKEEIRAQRAGQED